MATSKAEFRSVGKLDHLRDNYVNPYYLEDLKHRVSVARVDGKLYAFDDLCTHDSVPLSAGLLTGTTLMCQCDGSQFDVASGRVLRGPAADALVTYEVREQDGEIQVRV
jgi:nitrite reductase/ring-hydroxylating ferredoxin subunit